MEDRGKTRMEGQNGGSDGCDGVSGPLLSGWFLARDSRPESNEFTLTPEECCHLLRGSTAEYLVSVTQAGAKRDKGPGLHISSIRVIFLSLHPP